MKVLIRCGMLVLVSLIAVACGSKDDDEKKDDNPPLPGALMTQADTAMSSIAFEGQAAALTGSDWQDEHCEEEGNATKEEYEDDSSIIWGCLLSTKTDGPDTPRGAVNRLVQLGCEADRNIEDGDFKIDGKEHEFEAVIDDECWGKDFAEMVAEQLPKLVEEDGFVHFTMTATGHTSAPEDWTDVADEWDAGFELVFGLEDEPKIYRVLLADGDDGFAASILETEGDENNVFSMSVKSTGGANDEHDFRYEGRFGYGKFGDGMYGSRHVRVLVTGPYAGEGGFSAITSGSGYEAGMYGRYEDGDYLEEIGSGEITTFAASSKGIGTKDWGVDETGETNGDPTTAGVSGINKFDYTASDAQLKSFLTTDVAAFTKATTWHKTNGPVDFESVKISD